MHCLKYGLTTNNILGLEMVLIDGEIIRLGGKHLDAEGYDLLGVMTGSEGLLGVVTEITVRILPKPTAAQALLIGFPSNEEAGDCVAAIIAAGIIPGGMEMMDRPAIHAAEAFVGVGLSARCRGVADRRARRRPGRSRRSDRPGRGHRPRSPCRLDPAQPRRGRAARLLVRAQGRVSGGRPHLARLFLHGRHDPARPTGRGVAAHPGFFGSATGSPSPTCFTPATAISTR